MDSTRYKRIWRHLLHFLTGQISVQGLTFITGFLLLRWLSVEQYAQFSVAFAFQCTLNMLIDVGFSNSIVALVGNRGEDGGLVGSYIRSAQFYRFRMFLVMCLGSAVAFPLMTKHQAWGFQTKAILFAAIILSVFLQGNMMYGASLLIKRQLKSYYNAQLSAAVGRLIICLVLHKIGLLSGVVAVWASTFWIFLTGFQYHKSAQQFINEPDQSEPEHNREMLQYVYPLVPGIVFTALQGQISIVLITIFGHTKNIAEVAALGRLGVIFSVFTAYYTVIVEPYIARVDLNQLKLRYCQIALTSFGFGTLFTFLAFVYPKLYLWLLGPKYHHLQAEIGWIVLYSSRGYIAGALSSMNRARKWVYWSYTMMTIVAVIITQILSIFLLDIRTTHGVILFSFYADLSVLLVHMAAGIYGLYAMKNTDNMDLVASVPLTTPE